MAIRPNACRALADIIRENGKSIIKMPSSGQLYISSRLAKYPEERDLFKEALRLGIPGRILEHARSDEYETKLAEMSQEIVESKGVDPETAEDVVTAWAEALNRPVGDPKKAAPDRVYQDEPSPFPQKE